MKSVNYNEISKTYDDVRKSDLTLVQRLTQVLPPRSDLRILDLGCGTGNYTDLFQRLTQAQVFGVDPSGGMLEKAREKDTNVTFKIGQADNIPFENDFFDFTYMTDIIHHVPDIEAMFGEIKRVLKSGGVGCVVTQSHQQIEARPIAHYFPGTARVDKERYPDIPEIIRAASSQNFIELGSEILSEKPIELDADFLELVRKKGYSMLHLISDEEYQAGLQKLEGALDTGPVIVQPSGTTLVWYTKA